MFRPPESSDSDESPLTSHFSYSKHFNENYLLTTDMVIKLVEKTMQASQKKQEFAGFTPVAPSIPPKLTKRIISVPNLKPLSVSESYGKVISDDNIDSSTYQLHSVNDIVLTNQFLDNSTFKISLDPSLEVTPLLSSPLPPKVIPEYPLLEERAKQSSSDDSSKRVVSVANKKLGDYRSCILIEKFVGESSDIQIASINLKDNRISDKAMSDIINNLAASNLNEFVSLDLSENKVGFGAISALVNFMNKINSIQTLRLSSCDMGDIAFKQLFGSISIGDATSDENSPNGDGSRSNAPSPTFLPIKQLDMSNVSQSFLSLEILDISNNEIEVQGAKSLAKFLGMKQCTISQLDISWNKIKSEGSTYIFDALLCNTSLLALDISWNGAGGHYEVCDESDRVDRISKIGAVESPKKTSTTYTTSNGIVSPSAIALSKLFRQNKTLLHMNIANNMFTKSEILEIGQGLSCNNVVQGLHITGNPGSMDSHGFLRVSDEEWPLDASHTTEKILCDFEMIKYQIPNLTQSKRNCCWICEEYVEVEFVYQFTTADMVLLNKIIDYITEHPDTTEVRGYFPGKIPLLSDLCPVHLFSSFDNWSPEQMHLVRPDVPPTMLFPISKITNNFTSQTNQNFSSPTTAPEFQGRSPVSPLKGPPSGQNLLHVAHRKLKSNLSNYVDNKLKKIHENVAVINSGELSKDQTRRSSSLSLAGANIINEVDEYEKEIQSSMEFVDNDNDNDNGYEFNFDVDDIDYQDEANSPSALWSRMNTRLNFLDSFMEIDHKPSFLPGQGMLIREKSTAKNSLFNMQGTEQDFPIFKLKRSVPKGRHAFGFYVSFPSYSRHGSVIANNLSEDEQSCLLAFHNKQEHAPTKSLLSTEDIQTCLDSGIRLPPMLNVISNIPHKKKTGSKTSDAINRRDLATVNPRVKHASCLTKMKSVWRKNEAILYKQWMLHSEKSELECFHCDWKYSRTANVLSKDDVNELRLIKGVLMKYYILLKAIFLFYSGMRSSDCNYLSGTDFFELMNNCLILEPVDNTQIFYSKVQNILDILSPVKLYLPHPSEYPKLEIESSTPFSSVVSTTAPSTMPPPEVSPRTNKISVLYRQLSNIQGIDAKTIASVPFTPMAEKAIEQKRAKDWNNELNEDSVNEMASILTRQHSDTLNHGAITKQASFDSADETTRRSSVNVVDDLEPISSGLSSAVGSTILPNKSVMQLSVEAEKSVISAVKEERSSSTLAKESIADIAGTICYSRTGACDKTDLEVLFIANCIINGNSGKKNIVNSRKALNRSQFIDCVVGLAYLKYVSSEICKRTSEALERLIIENFGRYAMRPHDEFFLQTILPSKQIDQVLRSNFKHLANIFKAHANYDGVFREKVLHVSAFTTLQQKAGVIDKDTGLSDRECKRIFHLSKVNFNMDVFDLRCDSKMIIYEEFLEAVVRIAYACKKKMAENDMSGGADDGLSPESVAEQVAVIIKLMKKVSPSH